MADRVYKECREIITGSGNLTRDPKTIAEGVVAVNVAANYTKVRRGDDGEFYGEDGVNFRNIIVRRPHSEAVKDLKKGDAVTYTGEVFGNAWEDNEGNDRHSEEVHATSFGKDLRFEGYGKGGGSKSRGSSSSKSSGGSRKSAPADDNDDIDIDIDI